ncbi:MAG: YbaB/EbfC family nucleoid-associated protein [Alphaproteobacteria bacterium]
MAGMFDMMKKAQEMQKKLQQAQEELKTTTVTGVAAGGAVEVVMSGTFDVTKLTIKPSVVDADDVDTLQDVVMVAVNDAVRKVRDVTESKMKAATGGLKLPGM